ncbi:hypothetical protein [Deinococcus arenicola]|uniref:DUF5709 domain-containing protein n=1 Tax=Deinococcus arenicola TaxID=2994950 RepID=A0ABU4DM57_9DEIO|nr:hypothetical protein [Deinococcus sp. ZS9-10]MDV6373526.1 hypothetical protein [Deinococcus sp. ZS9-10]
MSDERRTDAPGSSPISPNVIGPETDGRTGAETGFDTPDPKDHHTVVYTTTPGNDRVGSADHAANQGAAHGVGAPPELESAEDITGKYDHLATRDVEAMSHDPEAPEFAGAQTVAGLGGEALDEVIPTAGLGVNPAAALGRGSRGADQNPGYVPPSEKVVPHVHEQPGDLLPGQSEELGDEISGNQR